MITKNDLYDITQALIIIRNNIKEELNAEVLFEIIKTLETDNSTDENQIRKAISSIDQLDRERWFFVYHNNVYVNHRIMNKPAILSLLVNALKCLLSELRRGNFDKAYDLADGIHCLPEIIADNDFKIPKSYWKTFVVNYRNKWDKYFLRDEQKSFGFISRWRR